MKCQARTVRKENWSQATSYRCNRPNPKQCMYMSVTGIDGLENHA